MGIFVSARNSDSGTATADSAPPELGMGGGTAPSGKTKLLPGSYETMARTFALLIAVRHPMPPLCECVTRMAGPIFVNNAATALAFTSMSMGPTLGIEEGDAHVDGFADNGDRHVPLGDEAAVVAHAHAAQAERRHPDPVRARSQRAPRVRRRGTLAARVGGHGRRRAQDWGRHECRAERGTGFQEASTVSTWHVMLLAIVCVIVS